MQPEYELELTTNFDFPSRLKQILEEEPINLSLTPPTSPTCGIAVPPFLPATPINEQLFDLSSLSPLTDSSPSCCSNPQDPSDISPSSFPHANVLEASTGTTLPIKRRATRSPDTSPTPSPSKCSSKRERRRENRRAKRRREISDAATTEPGIGLNAEPPVMGSTKKKRRRGGRKSKREREMVEPVTNPEQGGYAQTKYVKPSIPLKVGTNFKEAGAASTGYTGLDDGIRTRSDVQLEDLISGKLMRREFMLQRWDGK